MSARNRGTRLHEIVQLIEAGNEISRRHGRTEDQAMRHALTLASAWAGFSKSEVERLVTQIMGPPATQETEPDSQSTG